MIRPRKILKIRLFFIIIFFLSPVYIFPDTIRKTAWAGKFYPNEKVELKKTITSLTEKAAAHFGNKNNGVNIERKIKGIIFPHAGYIYSGFTAAHAGLVLKNLHFKKVILMGPDHRVGFRNGAISNVQSYETPLGNVPVHEDAKYFLKEYKLFKSVPESDMSEHSIEVILPFLQIYLNDFEFVPIVLGHGDVAQYANTIKTKVDDDTLLVASSDLSHFLNYDEAVKRDRETIDLILENKVDQLMYRDNCACGKIPIIVLLTIAKEKNWNPVLLSYTNSGDTAGDKRSVVGYTTIAFY